MKVVLLGSSRRIHTGVKYSVEIIDNLEPLFTITAAMFSFVYPYNFRITFIDSFIY